jgi:hypothetical protein
MFYRKWWPLWGSFRALTLPGRLPRYPYNSHVHRLADLKLRTGLFISDFCVFKFALRDFLLGIILNLIYDSFTITLPPVHSSTGSYVTNGE